jgi:TRAP-type mannitol/chloroaromatic compound transport system substrate-binding protein
MKKREFLKAGAGTAAALAALPAAAQTKGASYSWKMTTAWPGGPLMDIGAKAFAERLAFLSGGRMKIQVFPGGALGNALKVSETVKNGVAEMGHTWMGYDWGADPTTVLFGGYASTATRRPASSRFRCSSAPPKCSCTRASRSGPWPT